MYPFIGLAAGNTAIVYNERGEEIFSEVCPTYQEAHLRAREVEAEYNIAHNKMLRSEKRYVGSHIATFAYVIDTHSASTVYCNLYDTCEDAKHAALVIASGFNRNERMRRSLMIVSTAFSVAVAAMLGALVWVLS